MSHSLKSVGPNATLVADDFEKVIRRLKAELTGEIHVGGPALAQSLTEAGLIDEYRLYLRPVVLGGGQRFNRRGLDSVDLRSRLSARRSPNRLRSEIQTETLPGARLLFASARRRVIITGCKRRTRVSVYAARRCFAFAKMAT